MAVDSYLELFTTLFGWQWYGIGWDALSDTGIVYIPFAAMIIRTWKEAARGGSYGNVHDMALRSLEIEFYVAVFVALIASPPAVNLQANTLRYTPGPTLKDPAPVVATVATPDSSYGSPGAFSNAPGVVQIPVWWYTVLTLAKGFNHAVIAGVPNSVGMREIQQHAQLATISDARLRDEAAQFYNDCFIPARSKYLREKPTNAAITTILDDYGADDPDWMGSHVYRSLYYPNMRARRRVAGWPYDPARDVDYAPGFAHVWGQPTCDQWWNDSKNGIRTRIAATPEGSAYRNTLASAATYLAGFLPAMTNQAEKLTDKAVREALNNSRVVAMKRFQPDDLGTYSSRDGLLSNLYGAAHDVAAGVGAGITHFTLGTLLTSLKPMLPIAQSVILMAVYALLPVIVVLSGYSLPMIVMAAIGIFTIHFWTVLWKLAQWIDENLSIAMHPGNMDGLIDWFASPGGIVGSTSKSLLLDTMLAMFMIGMPVIWTMLMGWAGIRLGRSIEASLETGTRSTHQSGVAGASKATKKIR